MKKKSAIKFIFWILPLCFAFNACNHKDPGTTYQPAFSSDTLKSNTLLLGFPSFSYSETAQLLIKYLNVNLPGVQIKMQACASYEEYLDCLKQNKFDLTLINGFKAVEASDNGYSIIGKIADDNAYSGIIFTRKDADIKNVMDLKGKKVAMVSYKMLPGTMMPLYYLYENGLDVNHDIVRINVSSYESAIIATSVGESEGGICLKRSWNVYVKDHPEILSKVDLKWETPPLMNNALLVKNSLDSKIIARLTDLFFSMNATADGQAALKQLDIIGFEKADKDTYKPMLDFKRKYDSVIFQ